MFRVWRAIISMKLSMEHPKYNQTVNNNVQCSNQKAIQLTQISIKP